jgi:hypothetical protein
MKHSKTQSDMNLDFNGMEKITPSRSMKYCGNMYGGVQNPNKLVNKGRGPTVGNKSDDDSTYPDARVTPKLPAQGSVRDNINRGAQVRSSGGGRFPDTIAMPKTGLNEFNFGRGPTKGNQV